jgi:hypothetical protein
MSKATSRRATSAGIAVTPALAISLLTLAAAVMLRILGGVS